MHLERHLVGDLLRLEYGKPLPAARRLNHGEVPVMGANGIKAWTDEPYWQKPSIVVGRKGSAGELNLISEPFWPLDVTYFVTHDANVTDLAFLFTLLKSLNLPSLARGVKPGINRNDVYSLEVFVPELADQQRISQTLKSIERLKDSLVGQLALLQELEDSYSARALAGEM